MKEGQPVPMAVGRKKVHGVHGGMERKYHGGTRDAAHAPSHVRPVGCRGYYSGVYWIRASMDLSHMRNMMCLSVVDEPTVKWKGGHNIA